MADLKAIKVRDVWYLACLVPRSDYAHLDAEQWGERVWSKYGSTALLAPEESISKIVDLD